MIATAIRSSDGVGARAYARGMRRFAALVIASAPACGFTSMSPATGDDMPANDAPLPGRDAVAGDAPGTLDGNTACVPASSHDEDGDGVADSCDPCPQIAHEAATDTDGDHLPDACDPRPAIAGDYLVKFFGFDAGGPDLAGLGWMAAAGSLATWTHTGDDLVVDIDSGTLIVEWATGIKNHTIDVGFDVRSHPTTAGRHQCFFDALINASTNADSYIAGGFYYDANATNGRELFDYDHARSGNNGFLPLAESQVAPPTPGATYRMGLVSTTTQPSYYSTSSAAPIALTFADARHANEHVGLRTQNASTTIHWVAVYGY